MKRATQMLEERSMRVTPCRLFVLSEFIKKADKGLSEVDIEKRAAKKFDRVTIYRTLKTFIDQDIIHKVIDDDNLVKYALCRACDHSGHSHEHVHFKCMKCQVTRCLDEISIVQVELPGGYQKLEANYLIVGVCPDCNK